MAYKKVTVIYQGEKYEAIKYRNGSNLYTLIDVKWGWTAREYEDYSIRGKRCWNVEECDVKEIHEIYLGGE